MGSVYGKRVWVKGSETQGPRNSLLSYYHGYAGIASAFAALAHKKIKPGGVLALVLPLSIANGLSWESLREILAREYTDVTILSIASNGRDMSLPAPR